MQTARIFFTVLHSHKLAEMKSKTNINYCITYCNHALIFLHLVLIAYFNCGNQHIHAPQHILKDTLFN
jgi:hypothetical protein